MPRPITEPDNKKGKKLLAFLRERGLSLTRAAEVAGVRFEVIHRLLHDPDYVPEMGTITKIVDRLRCPLRLIAPKLADAA